MRLRPRRIHDHLAGPIVGGTNAVAPRDGIGTRVTIPP